MKASSSSLFLLLLLLPLASQTPIRSPQSLLEMLGEDLAALLASENGGDPSSLPRDAFARLLGRPRPLVPRDLPGPSAPPPDHAWALLVSDLLNAQKKFRGRAKKFMSPQGCFGMKLDRIGTLSGLGC